MLIKRQNGLGSQEPFGEVFANRTASYAFWALGRVAGGGYGELISDGCSGLGGSFGESEMMVVHLWQLQPQGDAALLATLLLVMSSQVMRLKRRNKAKHGGQFWPLSEDRMGAPRSLGVL